MISKSELDKLYIEMEDMREEWNKNYKIKRDAKYCLSHELFGLLLITFEGKKK
jgi:uncharacterized ferredoxin-like protein